MKPPSDPFSLGYRPSLDGLRGVAIVMVVLFHFHVPYFSSGFVGVDIFFVLSGFLITVLLCEERRRTGRTDFPAFYRRRALRLFPALGSVLIVLIVYAYLLRPPGRGIPMGAEILGAAFYVNNWLFAFDILPTGQPLGHTWSLSIEEQFYLTWPLLIALGSRSRWAGLGLPLFTGLAASASATFRAIHWSLYENWNRAYFGLDTRADALLWGCLAGLLVFRWTPSIALEGAGVLGLIAGSLLSTTREMHLQAGSLVIGVSTATLLMGLVSPGRSPVRRILEWPPLMWLGRISYGLYLWHFLVYHGLLKLGIVRGFAGVGIAASLAVAVLSYFTVERPFLRLSRRDRRP